MLILSCSRRLIHDLQRLPRFQQILPRQEREILHAVANLAMHVCACVLLDKEELGELYNCKG